MTVIKVATGVPTIPVALTERDWRVVTAALDARRSTLEAGALPAASRVYWEVEARLLVELETRGVHDAWAGV